MNVQQHIENKLKVLAPRLIDVENESHRHHVPPNSETHFKVTVVSSAFEGLLPVKRHQRVYSVLDEELAGPVHALALHLYTPAEWERRGGDIPASPDCRGGTRS
ncbi:BolA family protein [Carnimonas nigrificans]|uniref:BolA family protein n=1 Tax=Carnimonas nigrificans TaxID=64323 RepID=UPI00046E7E1D|nr:BolA/IbaG family iron-sulfur metabolism protein [Carnimonas nigrificans]